MRITDLKTTLLSLPFERPTRWPYGRWEGITVAVIELETDAGITGLGESLCSQQPAEAFKLFIDATRPFVVGQDPFDTEPIGKKIEALGGWNFGRYFGGYALGGIDMALWDLQGKACGQPLYKLLGGKIRSRSEGFKYLHHDQPERMAAEAAAAVTEGFGTIYCKYTDIDHLKAALAAIRQAVGPDPKLWVDFNGTLSPGFAVQFLRQLEPLDLSIVEQPVHPGNLEGMAHVRNSISAQILAHESCWTPAQALNVIKAGAADILSVDTRMTWGLWACKKVAGMAEAAGMPVIYHSPVEMGIAHAAALHLIASTPNFIMANQCMYDWVADDYIAGGKLPCDGPYMPVPEGPGLGVTLDQAKMEKYHHHYRQEGMYPVFGFDPADLAQVPPPLFPAY